MSRTLFVVLGTLGVMAVTLTSTQNKPTVTVKQDVIYGRVDGSALLADMGLPGGHRPVASHRVRT